MSATDKNDDSPNEPSRIRMTQSDRDNHDHAEELRDEASVPIIAIEDSTVAANCSELQVGHLSAPDLQSPSLDLTLLEAKAAIASRFQLPPDENHEDSIVSRQEMQQTNLSLTPLCIVPISIASLLDAKAIIAAQTALQATIDTSANCHRNRKAKLSRDHPVVESVSVQNPATSTMVHEESATPPTVSAQVVMESMADVLERERARFRQEVRDTVHAEAVHAEPAHDIPNTSGNSSGEQSPTRRVSAVAVVVLGLLVTLSVLVTRPSSAVQISSPPPFTLTTLAPSMAPLVILPDGRIAFTNTLQLRLAADAYMAESVDTVADSKVSQDHGHPIGTWDVSRVTDFSRVFNVYRDQRLALNDRVQVLNEFNESLSGWDVSNAVTMRGMFAGSVVFVGDSLAEWNVSRVTDFSYMFMQVNSFAGNLSMWDTVSAINMDGMFYQTSVFNGDLSRWNVVRVESMFRMFSEGFQFQGGDLSRWNVSRVRRMNNMFASTEDFNGNVSTWDTRNVEKMEYMFNRASAFSGNVSSWSVGKVSSMAGLFSGTKSFVGGDLTRWDTSRVTDMRYIFDRSGFRGDVSTWDVSRVTRFDAAFAHCDKLDSDLSRWNTGNAKILRSMFDHARMFTSNISSWNTSKVTHMFEMFHHADAFNSDVSRWDVSNVVDMSGMFNDAQIYAQNLCAWGPKLQPTVKVVDTFIGSACTDKSDPSTDPAVGIGPLCAVCV